MEVETQKQRMERGMTNIINLINYYSNKNLKSVERLTFLTIFNPALSLLSYTIPRLFASLPQNHSQITCICNNHWYSYSADIAFYLFYYVVVFLFLIHHLKLRRSLLRLHAHLPRRLPPNVAVNWLPFHQFVYFIGSIIVSFVVISVVFLFLLAYLCDSAMSQVSSP